jgi:hypothetical protein
VAPSSEGRSADGSLQKFQLFLLAVEDVLDEVFQGLGLGTLSG